METKSEFFVKTVTWRILATVITGVVVFIFTGRFGESSIITLTAAAVLTLAYYLHERFWAWLKNK